MIKCQYCDYQTTRRDRRAKMNRHVQSVHLKIKPYICKQCNFSSSHNWDLVDHMKVKHEELTFDCPYCSKTSTTQGNLKQHVEVVHEKRGFSCKLCPAIFASRSGLVE